MCIVHNYCALFFNQLLKYNFPHTFIYKMEHRSQSKVGNSKSKPEDMDIIKQTRKLVVNKSEQERFQIAKKHLFNSLDFKTPRLDIYEQRVPIFLKKVYYFQTNFMWRKFLILLGYLFMYAAFFGHIHPSYTLIGVEFGFLFIMILDVMMQVYHKRFHIMRPTSKFQTRFYIRTITIILLLADTIISASTQALPVRPFLIFRCVLPIIYDHQVRKIFYALFSSYIDIFVYVLFYTSVIIAFAIMANQFIQLPPGTKYDEFTGAYGALGKTIFIMYVLTTFDAYPDNQLVAIRVTTWIYGFFILFIFLNALFFVTIPTNVLLNSIKSTRSKTIIIDQIQQQHNLIMAFICLGGDSKLHIPYQKLIRFLLFVFNNEVRNLDKITEICRRLDQKVNGTIEVNEFMQLCKIIQSKNYLRPPRFSTFRKFNHFQSFLHNKLKLKEFIDSNKFKVVVAIFIIFTFINSLLTMYVPTDVFDVIDDVLMMIYIVQVLFKLIALGPTEFFQSYWNTLDLIIIIVGFIFEVAPQEIVPRNAAVIVKMFRIFRVTLLIRLVADWCNLSYRNQVYVKLTELVNQITLILPIVFKFFPLYMISFYFLGVVGVQAFWAQTQISPQDSPYSNYNQFSNFRSLLGSQFIFVQVLTQAGWSMVAYDHAYRYGSFFFTMLFFVLCHEIIVIILTSLLKGITWQVYNTIHQQHSEYKKHMIEDQITNKALKKRLQIFQEARDKIQRRQNILPDNLVTRQLYQKKTDREILAKLAELEQKNKGVFFHKNKKSKNESSKLLQPAPMYGSILFGVTNLSKNVVNPKNENQIMPSSSNYLAVPQLRKKNSTNKTIIPQKINDDSQRNFPANDPQTSQTQPSVIEDLKQEDIEKQIDGVLNQVNFHSGIKFSLKMEYPEIFVQYLRQKLKPIRIYNFKKEFDVDNDIFAKKESLNLLVHGLHTLLEIQTTERQQRSIILKAMVKKGLITEEQSGKLLTYKSEYEDQISFDYNWIIRKTYLSGINEDKVNQFQMQYFSAVYGKSFKQINKVTIYPLIRLEARLTYCFGNLLRYRQISTYQFFNTLTHIENKISVKLLQSGSLCKFVYQLDTNSESWFTVELKDSNDLRVHFIKNGIWIHHEELKKDQIYVGRDIFNWQQLQQRTEKKQGEKYLKSFYQTFQSLAFCINDYDKFFEPNPQHSTFDLYNFYRDVESCKRYVKKQFSISKIMLVMLSKEQDRQKLIPYSLSYLKYDDDLIESHKKKSERHYKLDQSETQMFEKLKNIDLHDQQMISQREGLPYSYIVNFLMQFREIMVLNERNFVFHVEKLFNQHFKQSQKARQPGLNAQRIKREKKIGDQIIHF